MKDLHDKCASEPGNRQFWAQVQKAGRKMSLISDEEADKHGGTSAISESKAEKVRVTFSHVVPYSFPPSSSTDCLLSPSCVCLLAICI